MTTGVVVEISMPVLQFYKDSLISCHPTLLMQKISTYERVETSPPSNLQTEPLYLRLIDEISQITKDDDDVLSTEKK